MTISTTELSMALTTLTPGRVPTLQQLGDYFGVSRERIRQLLLKSGLSKPSVFVANRPKCQVCGNDVPVSRKQRHNYICFVCQPKPTARLISCTCGQCGKWFKLTVREYNARTRIVTSFRVTPRITPLFCNRKCSGVYAGTHYGFIAHPPKKKYSGEGSLYHRKKATGICISCTLPAVPGITLWEKHQTESNTHRRDSRPYKPRTHRLEDLHKLKVEVICTICGKTYQTIRWSLLANEAKSGTKNHYCKECYPRRPHIYRNSILRNCELCGQPSMGRRCKQCYVTKVLNAPKLLPQNT